MKVQRRFVFIVGSWLGVAAVACGSSSEGNQLFGGNAGAAGAGGGASGAGGAAGDGGAAGTGGGAGVGGDGGGGGVGGGGGTGGIGGAGGAGGAGGGAGAGGAAGSGGGGPCAFKDNNDHDGDGWSHNQGDCNDCDPGVNPGAFDYAGNGLDEDCSGGADDEQSACDGSIGIDADALEAAKALGFCRKTTANAPPNQRTWGVVDAKWVLPDGAPPPANSNFPLGHGVLATFGVANTPKQGQRMLVLSSGTARTPSDPGYQDVGGFDKNYTSNLPPSFSTAIPACPSATMGSAHDAIALEVTLRVPTNARSLSLAVNFFSYEFPDFVCSTYNDAFAILLAPPPPGSNAGDVAVDTSKNPVSVASTELLRACTPQTAGGLAFTCPLGAATLAGTGFALEGTSTANHAATGWLTTQTPVPAGGQLTIRFAIWDAGDGVLDSTVLLDGATWSPNQLTAPSTGP